MFANRSAPPATPVVSVVCPIGFPPQLPQEQSLYMCVEMARLSVIGLLGEGRGTGVCGRTILNPGGRHILGGRGRGEGEGEGGARAFLHWGMYTLTGAIPTFVQ